MKAVVIENPILNPPHEAPARHFRFEDEGITDEVVEGRRPSSPAPSPSFATEATHPSARRT